MAVFVIDASVAIAGLSPGENHAASRVLVDRAIEESVAAPALWPFEVGNIVVMKHRRSLISAEACEIILDSLADIRVVIEPAAALDAVRKSFALALRHRLTLHDAAYLELALRLGLPLATLDRALISAAAAEKCQVLP